MELYRQISTKVCNCGWIMESYRRISTVIVAVSSVENERRWRKEAELRRVRALKRVVFGRYRVSLIGLL
ncbi:hypothetical protein Hanom_Chr02g00153361 [Helianthus anomalus]